MIRLGSSLNGLLLFVQQSTFIQPRWLNGLRIIVLTHATRLDTELGEATNQQQVAKTPTPTNNQTG